MWAIIDRGGGGTIALLVAAALGFFFSGPVAGGACLALALLLGIVLYTPLRGRLGLPSRKGGTTREGDDDISIEAGDVTGSRITGKEERRG